MAELYWKKGIAAVENSTEDEDVSVYAGIAQRLAGLKYLWGEYEAALKIAQPAVDRLEKLGRDTTSEYTNLLIYAGCCQCRHGISEATTYDNMTRAYNLHLDYIKRHPIATSYRDAIVGVICISYTFIEINDYDKALVWLSRMAELIRGYLQTEDARPDYAEKQLARYYIYRAIALEGVHRSAEAAEAYQTYLKPNPYSRGKEPGWHLSWRGRTMAGGCRQLHQPERADERLQGWLFARDYTGSAAQEVRGQPQCR